MGEGVRRFEDLVAWQKSRALTRAIYRITQRGSFSRDFGLARQIQRAAVSVMSNIAEGFERGSLAEFHQFLMIAKGSCDEVRSQLYVAFDARHIDEDELDELPRVAGEVARVIGGLRASIDPRKDRTRHRQQ